MNTPSARPRAVSDEKMELNRREKRAKAPLHLRPENYAKDHSAAIVIAAESTAAPGRHIRARPHATIRIIALTNSSVNIVQMCTQPLATPRQRNACIKTASQFKLIHWVAESYLV